LQADQDELENEQQYARLIFEQGAPPIEDAVRKWNTLVRMKQIDEERLLQLMQEPPIGEVRINVALCYISYVPEDGIGLLVPYNELFQQFKPSDQGSNMQQPSAFMANFQSDQMEKGASNSSLKSCRGALAVRLSFIGHKEEEVHSTLVAQLMKPVLMRTRHKDREIEQWDLNIFLEQITKEEVELLRSNMSIEEIMTISLTLCMILTVARLAELFRATLINETKKEITLETVILKKPSRIIELKLKKALNQRICPVRWWKAWYNNRDKDLNPTTGYLWNTSKLNRTNSQDSLSKGIRSLMQKAGIARGFTVTSVRSATISKLINMGANATAVDRFTHHSDVANNDKVRALIVEVKDESAGESESEIEAEEELGLANHTPGTMGLSPKEESELHLCLPVHGSPARKKKKKKNQKDGAPTCPKSVSARGEGKEQQQNRKRKSKKESQ
ncbi:MAG: hypothetical protein EZS28_017358, partial [Streblomastix strix]